MTKDEIAALRKYIEQEVIRDHPLPWQLVQYEEFGARSFVACPSARAGATPVIADVHALTWEGRTFFARAPSIILQLLTELEKLENELSILKVVQPPYVGRGGSDG